MTFGKVEVSNRNLCLVGTNRYAWFSSKILLWSIWRFFSYWLSSCQLISYIVVSVMITASEGFICKIIIRVTRPTINPIDSTQKRMSMELEWSPCVSSLFQKKRWHIYHTTREKSTHEKNIQTHRRKDMRHHRTKEKHTRNVHSPLIS